MVETNGGEASDWRPKERGRIQNLLLRLYFIYATIATFFYAVLLARHPHEWAVEDWLLNYRGGFVRRGVTGEIAFGIGALLHVEPQWIVCAMQLLCYGFIFWAVYALLCRSGGHSPWTWALVLSPATFAFQLVDHVGGFRKEILLFAGLAALLLLLRRGATDKLITLLLCLWLPFTILAHESIFFYIGYYGAAVLLYQRHQLKRFSFQRAIAVLLLPLLLSVAAMAAVCLHPGNKRIAAAVCSSIERADGQKCGEAIEYLGFSRQEARADTEAARHKNNFSLLYGITGTLALLPIAVMLVAGLRDKRTRSDALLLCAFALGTFLVSLPLYLYALDWGRWIYMNVMCLTLLLFFLDWDHTSLALPGRAALQHPGRQRLLALCLLGIYATTWTLPHMPSFGLYYGYVQRIDHAKIIRHLSARH